MCSFKMIYLDNFLHLFSLRFGCRVIAIIEIVLYASGCYFMVQTNGLTELVESIITISLLTSGVLAVIMFFSTLQEHESAGIMFTYLMWGILTTVVLPTYYIYQHLNGGLTFTELIALLVVSTIVKIYAMWVVLSFLNMLTSPNSEVALHNI